LCKEFCAPGNDCGYAINRVSTIIIHQGTRLFGAQQAIIDYFHQSPNEILNRLINPKSES
jgi:hypothetical protein